MDKLINKEEVIKIVESNYDKWRAWGNDVRGINDTINSEIDKLPTYTEPTFAGGYKLIFIDKDYKSTTIWDKTIFTSPLNQAWYSLGLDKNTRPNGRVEVWGENGLEVVIGRGNWGNYDK